VRYISVTVPGTAIQYQQDDDTTYVVDVCADGSSIVFDAHSSSDTEVANNAWVHASLNDTSVLCEIRVNSELSANGAAGLVFAEGLTEFPSSITLKRIENPANNGKITAGNLFLTLMRVPHTEISIPKSAEDIPIVIDIQDTPCGGDLVISGAGTSTAVNFIASQSFVAVLRARVVINPEVIEGKPGLFISGGDESMATVSLDFDEHFSSMTVNGGCLTVGETPVYASVSEWMVEVSKSYGMSVPKTVQCDLMFDHISDFATFNIEKAKFVYLGKDSTPAISINRDNGGIDMSLVSGAVSDFSAIKQSSDGNIYVSYADGIGGFVVHSFTSATEEGIHVSVSEPGFAKNSKILLDCASSDRNYTWSLDPVETSATKSPLLARMRFTSPGCSGSVSNIVGKDPLSGPAVVLGSGFDTRLYVRSAPSKRSHVFGDNNDRRTLRLDTDDEKAYFHLLSGFESNSLEDDKDFVLLSLLDKYSVGVDNAASYIVNYEWPKTGTKNITIVLGDGNKYVWSQSSYITENLIVNATVTKDTSVSFHISGTPPVSFFGAKSGSVIPSKTEITLNPATPSDVFCFNPISDCTAAAWARASSLDRLCPSPSSQAECRASARAALNVVSSGNALLYCGAASWDPVSDNSSSSGSSSTSESHSNNNNNRTIPGLFSLNAPPKAQPSVLVSQHIETAVTAIVFASAVLTVIGFSAMLPCLFRPCLKSSSSTSSSSFNEWWVSAAHRDALTDQFAWLPLVATAALSEARDADFLSWGGSTASLLLRTRRLVLSWLRPCPSDSVSGPWLAPPFLIFSVSLVVSLTLRIVMSVLSHKNVVPAKAVRTGLTALHSILSAACLLLLPHAVFLPSFLASTEAFYFYVLPPVFLLLVIFCQPLPPTSRSCVPPFFAALSAAVFPAALALYAGIGSNTVPALISTASAVLLSAVLQLVLLWKGFFRKAPRRGFLWRCSWGSVLVFRLLGALSGICFCAVLFLLGKDTFGDQKEKGQTVSTVLWFVWVGLTWLSSVPLMTATGPVLEAEKRVAITQSRDLVTVPLLDDEDGEESDSLEREEENRSL